MPKLIDVIFTTKPSTVNSRFMNDPESSEKTVANGASIKTMVDNTSIYYRRKLVWGDYKIKTNNLSNTLSSSEFFEEITNSGDSSQVYYKIEEQYYKPTYSSSGVLTSSAWVSEDDSRFIKKEQLPTIYEIYDMSVHNFVGTVKLKEIDLELLDGYRASIQLDASGNPITDSGGMPVYIPDPTGLVWKPSDKNLILDVLTSYLNDNLAIQFELGRLTSDTYAQAYIQGIQAILQTSTSYLQIKASLEMQAKQTESAIEKNMASTETSQRQTRAFDDSNAMKYLSEISSMAQMLIGADIDDKDNVPRIGGGNIQSPVDSTFIRFARFLGLPEPETAPTA